MKFVLQAEVIEEAGYDSALHGLSFNKKQEKDMCPVALKLCSKDGGHNKFLESIVVWIEVTAPRYWWQEADTFRLSTKQSESTMHTLVDELKSGDFTTVAGYFESECLSYANFVLLKETVENRVITESQRLVMIKRNLPEGFLQKRLWCMNYKCLRNIIMQRKTHRLPHWQSFINQVMGSLKNPELLQEACKGITVI